MRDTNPTPVPPTPTPPPEPPKKPAAERGDINQAWLDEISATEKFAVVAAKTDYAAKLAKRKIDAAWLTKLNADFERARMLTGQAIGIPSLSRRTKSFPQSQKQLLEIHCVQKTAISLAPEPESR